MHPRRPRSRLYAGVVGCWLAVASSTAPGADPAPVATASSTLVIEFEGRVEVLRKGAKDWEPAKKNQALEPGHRLRTGPKSRATLRLSNLSYLRVGESMEYEIEPPRSPGGKPTLSIKAGAAYFFSRD